MIDNNDNNDATQGSGGGSDTRFENPPRHDYAAPLLYQLMKASPMWNDAYYDDDDDDDDDDEDDDDEQTSSMRGAR